MAKFKYYNGNQGFYGYQQPNSQEYNVTKLSEKGMTLVYNGSAGSYDATRHPYRVQLIFKGAEAYRFEQGPNAGKQTFIDGEITEVRYYNSTSDLLLKVTGLKVDLAWTGASHYRDGLWNLNKQMYRDDSVFTGSNDSQRWNWDGDDIQTGYGKDTVKAGGGNDYIKDRYGVDKYDGGAGDGDTVSYDQAFWEPHLVKSGIRADLTKGKIVGYDGFTDTVKGIENVRGTYLADTFIGDGKNNEFRGLQGRDSIDGRGGFDRVSYDRDFEEGGTDGVKVELDKGRARDGFGHVDKLKSIEGAAGTQFNDTMVGSKGDNWFRGLDGGDKFVFRGSRFGHDVIDDFDVDEGDRLVIAAASSIADLDIRQNGSTAIIEFGSSEIKLWNVSITDLDADAFVF